MKRYGEYRNFPRLENDLSVWDDPEDISLDEFDYDLDLERDDLDVTEYVLGDSGYHPTDIGNEFTHAQHKRYSFGLEHAELDSGYRTHEATHAQHKRFPFGLEHAELDSGYRTHEATHAQHKRFPFGVELNAEYPVPSMAGYPYKVRGMGIFNKEDDFGHELCITHGDLRICQGGKITG
jgi:hypothetical protein